MDASYPQSTPGCRGHDVAHRSANTTPTAAPRGLGASPTLAPPAEGRTGASRADSGSGRLWGCEAATALPRPQSTGCTAPLPALRVTQRLLCAPSARSQAPTHSAHSWHSRLCRAGAAPSPTPAAAVRWGGGWQRARVSANRPACPWDSPRSARRDTGGFTPSRSRSGPRCLPCCWGAIACHPAARLLSRLPSSCKATLPLSSCRCHGRIRGNSLFLGLILRLRRPQNSL